MAEDADKVAALVDRLWEQMLEVDPLIGTEVGDERYDDRLPDPSDAGLAVRDEMARGALEAAGAIDRTTLDFESRAGLDLVEAIARRELDSIKYRMDRFEAVRHIYGPGQLLAIIGSLQRADTPERLDRYAARLSAIPSYLEAVSVVALGSIESGQTMPGLIVERTIAQVERLLDLAPEASPGVAPVPETETEGLDRVSGILRDQVWPAYRRYLDALRQYRPHARDTIGFSDLPDGEAMYASQVLAYTTLPLEPRTVHEIGQQEMRKIQEERRVIAGRLGYQDAATAVAELAAGGRNAASNRGEMLKFIEEQVQRSWDAAPLFFGRLPNANCEVRPVEEFREKDMPAAFYYPPSHDGTRAGIYYINLSGLPQRPLHRMASITFHEANPGHHFQISIEQEFTERPALRRFGGIMAGSAFPEGWGLYCERLAEEMGLYRDDYEVLGMLEAQGWRAVRLIADTGIHAMGWTREQAVAKMNEAGILGQDAEIEIDRYIAWPGQALSYKIGQHEIERWRAEEREREGASFSLVDFHDRLLALGSLPLPALQRELQSSAA